jgi:hypothetical protein
MRTTLLRHGSHLALMAVVLWAGEMRDGHWTWTRLATFGSVTPPSAAVHMPGRAKILCETLRQALPREVLAFDQTTFLCLEEGVMPPLLRTRQP